MRRLTASLGLVLILAAAGCDQSSGPSIPRNAGSSDSTAEVGPVVPGGTSSRSPRKARGQPRTAAGAPGPARAD